MWIPWLTVFLNVSLPAWLGASRLGILGPVANARRWGHERRRCRRGATKIAAGVVSPEGKVLGRVRYPTAKTPDKLLSGIVRAVLEVRNGFEVEGVCVAVPGLLLSEESVVVDSPNLHAIEGIPLNEELEPNSRRPDLAALAATAVA